MVGMMQAVVETPGGAGKVILNGELLLDQDEAILIDNVRRTLFDTDPILNDYSALSLNEIIEVYQNRKEKLIYDYLTVVQPYASPHKSEIVINC